jgi:hypothetical protein
LKDVDTRRSRLMAKTKDRDAVFACGHYGYDAGCRAAAARIGSRAELIRLAVRLA